MGENGKKKAGVGLLRAEPKIKKRTHLEGGKSFVEAKRRGVNRLRLKITDGGVRNGKQNNRIWNYSKELVPIEYKWSREAAKPAKKARQKVQ